MRVIQMLNHTPNKFNRRIIKKLNKKVDGTLSDQTSYRVKRMTRHYMMIDEVAEFDRQAAKNLLNMLRFRHDICSQSYAEHIDRAFLWDKTPQGGVYWGVVDKKLNKHRTRKASDAFENYELF